MSALLSLCSSPFGIRTSTVCADASRSRSAVSSSFVTIPLVTIDTNLIGMPSAKKAISLIPLSYALAKVENGGSEQAAALPFNGIDEEVVPVCEFDGDRESGVVVELVVLHLDRAVGTQRCARSGCALVVSSSTAR